MSAREAAAAAARDPAAGGPPADAPIAGAPIAGAPIAGAPIAGTSTVGGPRAGGPSAGGPSGSGRSGARAAARHPAAAVSTAPEPASVAASGAAAATPAGRNRWCAGLRYAGRRRLTLAEFADLRRVLRRLRAQVLTTSLVLLLSPGALVLLGLAATWDMLAPGLQVTALLAGVALVTLGLPIGLLRVRDVRRRARRLHADLLAGHVEHFKGRIERPNPLDPAQRRLRRLRLLADDDAVPVQWLEVLPRCEHVLAVNGRLVDRWVEAPIRDVSSAPPAPAAAAPIASLAAPPSASPPSPTMATGSRGATQLLAGLPAELTVTDPNLVLRRRQLTTEELRELRSYARRWHIPSGWTVCWALVLALVLLDWPRQEATFLEFALLYRLQLAVTALGLLLGVGFYVRDLLFARDLQRDQQLGWTLTVHPRAPAGIALDADDPPLRELLPTSRCVWSEGGLPAAWRLVRW